MLAAYRAHDREHARHDDGARRADARRHPRSRRRRAWARATRCARCSARGSFRKSREAVTSCAKRRQRGRSCRRGARVRVWSSSRRHDASRASVDAGLTARRSRARARTAATLDGDASMRRVGRAPRLARASSPAISSSREKARSATTGGALRARCDVLAARRAVLAARAALDATRRGAPARRVPTTSPTGSRSRVRCDLRASVVLARGRRHHRHQRQDDDDASRARRDRRGARQAELRDHRHGRARVRHDATSTAEHTTPEADELARAHARRCARAARRTSRWRSRRSRSRSGASRAVRFRVAALTNLTQDHLDFHGSMEAYADAKAKLFHESRAGRVGRQRRSTRSARASRAHRGRRARRVSAQASRARGRRADEARARRARHRRRRANARRRRVALRSPLVGAHNLENLLVALGVAYALELDLDARRRPRERSRRARTTRALRRRKRRRHRARRLRAHARRARARARRGARGRRKGESSCVFGCGGDRDAASAGRWARPSRDAPTSPSSRATTRAPKTPPSHREARSSAAMSRG